MLDQEIGSFSVILITNVYLIIVPSAVAVWFIWNRISAADENATRVNVEQTAERDRASAPPSTRTDDQESRDGQVAQAYQSQMISIASSIESP